MKTSLILKIHTGSSNCLIITLFQTEDSIGHEGAGLMSPYLEAERLKRLSDSWESQSPARTETTVACQNQQAKYCSFVRGRA